MELLTRRNGIWLMAVGIAIFLLNFLTMTLWEIDIDILGVMIFILGVIVAVACGKTMKNMKHSSKNSSKLLTRKNGVWLCIITVVMTALLAYSPFPALNGDITGFVGLVVFLLGIIIIAVRWKH